MTVIVGLSNTPLGQLAIERGAQEAERRGQPLVIATGVTMRNTHEDRETYPARRQRSEEEVRRRAGELSATRGVHCIPFISATPASAAEAILDAAREHEAELVVIGIKRRSPVGKAFLGSTSQDVLLRTDCDVLGVKLPAGSESER